MVKSKIKKNPYAQFYLMQLEMIEKQRKYWLKHPKEFVRDLVHLLVDVRGDLSIDERNELKKILEG